MDPGNFITKHWLEKHRDEDTPPEFIFKVNRVHKDALSREIDEALHIQMVSKVANTLNSKSEWQSNTLSRLCIEKSVWEQKKLADEEIEKKSIYLQAAKEFKGMKSVVSFNEAIQKLELKSNSSMGQNMAEHNKMQTKSRFKMAPKFKSACSKFVTNKNLEFFRSYKRGQQDPIADLIAPKDHRESLEKCTESEKTASSDWPEASNDIRSSDTCTWVQVAPNKKRKLYGSRTQCSENLLKSTATRTDARPQCNLDLLKSTATRTDARPQCSLDLLKYTATRLDARPLFSLREMKPSTVGDHVKHEGDDKGCTAENETKYTSFDECIPEGSNIRKSFPKKSNAQVKDKEEKEEKECFLWSLRGCNNWVRVNKEEELCGFKWGEGIVVEDSFFTMAPPMSVIVEAEAVGEEDYKDALPSREQDELTKILGLLLITPKEGETEEQKSMDSEMDENVLEFAKLLSSKLDLDQIPNLFGNDKLSPTSNLLTKMLGCHKLRTTFDFEKAVERVFKNDCRIPRGWNFRILDKIAGVGTTAATIFELKKNRTFTGAKRKLNFNNLAGGGLKNEIDGRGHKCPKLEEINHLIDKLDLGEDKTRREEAPGEGRTNKSPVIGLKVIKTTAGWGTRKTPPSRKSKNNKNETRMVPRNKRAWSKQSSIRGYFISSPKVGKVGEVVLDKENGRTACNEAD